MKNYEELNLTHPESEEDPFTEDRYRPFCRFFPQKAVRVLDVRCNTGTEPSRRHQLSPLALLHMPQGKVIMPYV